MGQNLCNMMNLVGPPCSASVPPKVFPSKKNPPKVHENLKNKQSLNIMLCCVSETKGQDQPEDEDAAKARPELEQGESRLLQLRQRNRSSN